MDSGAVEGPVDGAVVDGEVTVAIVGARIRAMDPDGAAEAPAGAVALSGSRIVAVGSDEEIRRLCTSRTDVVDGSDLVVTPGLVDSHSHWLWGAAQIDWVDFSPCASVADVQAVLSDACRRAEPGAWIRGNFLEYSAFPGGVAHRRHIEQVCGDHPVYLAFFDCHSALVNGAALRAAGVDEAGPSRGEGVVRDADGLSGLLLEFEAMDVVRDTWPATSDEHSHRQQLATMALLNRLGITGVHMMNGRLDTADLFRELEATGDLSLRIDSTVDLSPSMTDDDVRAFLPHLGERGPLWGSGAVKLWLDGVIESGTAWLREPDDHGVGRSPLWVPPERYRRFAQLFAEAGFRCTTHAIGDQAVAYALDTYATLPNGPQQRHRIEHLEVTTDEDVSRLGAEGVVASVQPQHMMYLKGDRSDAWSQRVGPVRADQAFRLRDLHDGGAVMVLGSDWPCAPLDPRVALAWAQLRRPPGRPQETAVGRADQTLTSTEAFAGYTTNAAWVTSSEHERGRVRAGYLADLVAWTEDPVTCPPDRLSDVQAVLTIVDGRVRHRSQ
jgi:predicted amidohydrolase YtcJ